jgi:lipase maturation factor
MTTTPGPPPPPTYWLTRFVFLRMLGFLYLVAFVIVLRQFRPLAGEHGLLPAPQFLEAVGAAYGHEPAAFLRLPTIFWLDASDGAFAAGAWAGIALSSCVALGLANAPILAALWLLYMSFVHVGQLFYGYGWEMLLLEAGFLAIFLCPLWSPRPFPRKTPPSDIVIVLLRWLAFRLMFGAGLIKLRGDPCWRDLTCMLYHYETQPLPNPLSLYLHFMPAWFHRGEVLFNHFAELVVPWFVFGPRTLRHLAGALLVAFQVLLILSGNLSFLNWLTIAICLSCFDDGAWARVLPAGLRARAAALSECREKTTARRFAERTLAVVIAVLSVNPVLNMLSPGQVMNATFDPFELVNTYGAFGSIGRERNEIVLQGTYDAEPGPDARWIDYEFKCKPGDVLRRPCVVSPYHYRLDWQMWFAAMSRAEYEPWLLHLVDKLLRGDPAVLSLMAEGPFRRAPPRYIRAELFRYQFARPGEGGHAWWRRTRLDVYLPPLGLDSPLLREGLDEYGWRDR